MIKMLIVCVPQMLGMRRIAGGAIQMARVGRQIVLIMALLPILVGQKKNGVIVNLSVKLLFSNIGLPAERQKRGAPPAQLVILAG